MLVKEKEASAAEIDSGSYFDEVMSMIGLETGGWCSLHAASKQGLGSDQDSAVDGQYGSRARWLVLVHVHANINPSMQH